MKIAGEQLKTLETGKYAKNAIDIVGKQQRQKTNHFFERKMYKTCRSEMEIGKPLHPAHQSLGAGGITKIRAELYNEEYCYESTRKQ